VSGLVVTSTFEALAARLLAQAKVLGVARGAARALARTAPQRVWRRADLLWPTFTKG